MRLIKHRGDKFSLTRYLPPHEIPQYAILSHTWGPDTDEVSYQDFIGGAKLDSPGYDKIRFCAKQAAQDGLRYFWIDTCCIDKSSSAELQEAINSMFRWYQNAARCYVYLADVSAAADENSEQNDTSFESALQASRWFTRGWTLQELIAPTSVDFFTKEGKRLGDKGSLEQQIHVITGIATSALRGDPPSGFDIEERFRWAETRQTTREEDSAYCLLGIFDVYLPLIYGEGKTHALYRLNKEISEARKSKTRPQQQATNSVWMVPFERNPAFTSREPELKALSEALFTPHRTAKLAITGLGGVGKTQLALELIYRVKAERNDCSILWMPATSKESLVQAYLIAAKQLGISGCEADRADVVQLVQDYLSDQGSGQWLLVFDNADDISMWTDPSMSEGGCLLDYLPKSSHGSILFTTRDKKAAIELAGREVFEISQLDGTGAEQLLRNLIIDQKSLEEPHDVSALLFQLGYLPLAIVQAAVYINQNGIDLREYIALLAEQEEDVIALLSEDFQDEGRYSTVKNPVATTWLVSFEQIRERDPLAADFLSFMACLDPKDIPRALLPSRPSRKRVTDAFGTLQGFSFINKQHATSAITIHRLVHIATRNWLRREGRLDIWVHRAVRRLTVVLTDPNLTDRVVWRSYLPHACYLLDSTSNIEYDKIRLPLLEKYVTCLRYEGRYQELLGRSEELVKLCTRVRGEHDADTLTCMADLAISLQYLNRLDEALSLNTKVLELRRTLFGVEDLASMHNLATVLSGLGRQEEALVLHGQVLETQTRTLGRENPATLTSMDRLARVLACLDRWDEAESLYTQAVQSKRRVLGQDHPSTLVSATNLAMLLAERGRLEDGASLSSQVLETQKRVIGEHHRHTLTTMHNLAVIRREQGQHLEATAMLETCIQSRWRTLGPGHPVLVANLATLNRWKDQDRLTR